MTATTRPRLTEADFQAQVLDLAKTYGWWALHHPDSRRATAAGMPDLVLCRPPRLLMVELKKADGRLSAAQRRVLAMLADSGVEVAVWRPGDLDHIARVLGPRGEATQGWSS